MNPVLNILIVEDAEDDALLILRELKKGGYHVASERVETEEAMTELLTRKPWDIIIADYTMPQFSGLEALALVKKIGLDIPLIISSGAISEEVAVSAMKAGASDYVIKDNLARLLPAVEREIREAQDRRNRRRALHHSEERYRRLFEDALTGNFIANADGVILDCNPAFRRIFGFSDAEEAQGACLYDLYPKISAWQAFLDQLNTARKLENHEAELRCRDKTSVYVIQNIVGVFNDQDRLVEIQGHLIDDTARREMEKQMVQSQRMESLGTLAGGIAHDFNNLLTVISGYSDMVYNKLEDREDLAELMEEVINSADRAAILTQQILAFSRRQIVQPTIVHVGNVINNTSKMMTRLISENVHLNTTIAPDLKCIKIDPVQVEQIIMNMAVNARDAMPDGGQFDIKAYNLELTTEDTKYLDGLSPGGHVVLEMRDTGVGMDEQTIDHIFEPFFTTKDINEGTGLGLSTVYGIVTQNNGAIRVESAPGEGTAFFIYFPKSDETAAAVSSKDPQMHGGLDETILLVEDDASVRNMAQTGLVANGYKVLAAPDGVEAVKSVTSADRKIHLLITDIVMPNMNGHELTHKMLKMMPDVKVLLISGYLEKIEAQENFLNPQMYVLPKPFTINKLLQKVRSILDHPI